MCKPPLLDNQAPADEAGEPEDLQTASEDSALKQRLDLQTGEDGLSEEEAARRLLQHGRNELPDLRTPKWRIFLSHFTGIMPGTIIIAIIIEGLLQAPPPPPPPPPPARRPPPPPPPAARHPPQHPPRRAHAPGTSILSAPPRPSPPHRQSPSLRSPTERATPSLLRRLRQRAQRHRILCAPRRSGPT